ncbi:MAG: hypothetical protein AAGD43_22850 [Pseudomonadota bacterium]
MHRALSVKVGSWHFPVMQLPAEMRPEAVIPHDFLPEWRLSGAQQTSRQES